MSTEQKTKEQLLHAYKKANKERKKVIFAKAGFLDETSYLNFLLRKEEPKVENNKTSRRTKKKVPSVSLQKIVLHNIDISDATGSMSGAKYEKSKKGILAGIENLKKDPNADWKYTLVEFVQQNNVIQHSYKTPINEVGPISFWGAHGSNTPLYEVVYNTLLTLERDIPSTEKVLVKVYTDGGDTFDGKFRSVCANKIAEVKKKNFTVTFVATNEDLAKITRELNLDESNTLAVTNDSAGFDKAFKMSMSATRSYAEKASKGLDVSLNFYGKKVGTL